MAQNVNKKLLLKIKSIIEEDFRLDADSLIFLGKGEFSEAYSFTANNKAYVFRVGSNLLMYQKDKFAAENYANSHIPIPAILRLGEFSQLPRLYYCVSDKCPGKGLETLRRDEAEQLIPRIAELTLFLRNVQILKSKTKGFGEWDKNGTAPFRSWREYLRNVSENIMEIPKNLPELADYQTAYIKFGSLVGYMPEERHLIHGDLGFRNLFSDGNAITGLIDWGESKYGDFLYDISYLIFWSKSINYYSIFKTNLKKENFDPESFDTRVSCYLNLIYMETFFHYDQRSDQESMLWLANRLAKSQFKSLS